MGCSHNQWCLTYNNQISTVLITCLLLITIVFRNPNQDSAIWYVFIHPVSGANLHKRALSYNCWQIDFMFSHSRYLIGLQIWRPWVPVAIMWGGWVGHMLWESPKGRNASGRVGEHQTPWLILARCLSLTHVAGLGNVRLREWGILGIVILYSSNGVWCCCGGTQLYPILPTNSTFLCSL